MPHARFRPAHRALCAVTAAAVLAGCAQGGLTTQAQRIGADDGTDSCRRELVALDSTGDFFAEDIIKGAAIGALGGALIGGLAGGGRGALIGAASGLAAGAAGGYLTALQQQAHDQAGMYSRARNDMTAESLQLDKTQLAFNQLVNCRFYQAQTIRVAYRQGQIPRAVADQQMAVVRQRAERDLALAQMINGKIQERGAEFDLAADKLSPGTAAYIQQVERPRTRTVVARSAVPIQVSPTAGAPQLAQAKPREKVTVQSTQGGYALVETSSGLRGYAPVSSLNLPPAPPPPAQGDVRTLAGSNANRRDAFAQSVAVAKQAQASAFEVAS